MPNFPIGERPLAGCSLRLGDSATVQSARNPSTSIDCPLSSTHTVASGAARLFGITMCVDVAPASQEFEISSSKALFGERYKFSLNKFKNLAPISTGICATSWPANAATDETFGSADCVISSH